jgi:hypothetical protein
MEAIGGKKISILLLSMILWFIYSCDVSKPIMVNGEAAYCLNAECGKVCVRASKFSSSYFFSINLHGSYLINPDSLKIGFYPKSLSIKNTDFGIYFSEFGNRSDDQRINISNPISINDKVISFNFLIQSDVAYSYDTTKIFILPCNFILCNNKPVITDTINIHGYVKK